MISSELLQFINYLADLSTPIAKKYFRLPNGEIAKEDDSPVTKADREIEEIIRAEIMKKFPTHGIIGEEYGTHNENADFVWILDPIDGTQSFIVGRPLFGTLIALAYRGEVILGLMNQPINNERWIGVVGQGTTLNGKKIQTRKCHAIKDAVLGACSPYFFQSDDEKKIFSEIATITKYQRCGGVVYGGDCYLYAMIATGCLDLIVDPGLKVYDYAALIPIIEEAGGVVTDWNGEKLKLQSGVRIVAAATKELHAEVIKITKRA